MSLFGGSASQTRTRNLLEFKAGKMTLRGTMVHPDKRKGLVYIHQGNDMLMHFCWKDRASSGIIPEDDLVIFPDEVEFKKVTQNTTGRVYILKWRTLARKLFFWMQEPKDDKDDELCEKVNNLLNHPPTLGFNDEGGAPHPLQPLMERMAGGGGAGGLDHSDLSNVLRGMNPNDFASLFSSFGGAGGPGILHERSVPGASDSRPNTAPAGTRFPGSTSTTSGSATNSSRTTAAAAPNRPRESGTHSSASAAPTATAPRPASSAPKASPIQMSALTSVLSNLTSQAPAETAKPSIDLNDIITRESLASLLSNKDVQEKLKPHLPEGHPLPNTEKEFCETVQSPHVRQAISAFSVALQSGQLGPVLNQFQLPADVIDAANKGDIQAFAKALENHHKSSTNESSANKMDTN